MAVRANQRCPSLRNINGWVESTLWRPFEDVAFCSLLFWLIRLRNRKHFCFRNMENHHKEKIMINITFPDGAVRGSEAEVTTFWNCPIDQQSQLKRPWLVNLTGKLIDTTRAITEDGSIEIVTPEHEDALPIYVTQLLHHLNACTLVVFSQTFTGSFWSSHQDGFTTILTTLLVKF